MATRNGEAAKDPQVKVTQPLGLEQKLVAAPLPALRKEIAGLVHPMIDGLIARRP